jgi:putative DNA primase/helicase
MSVDAFRAAMGARGLRIPDHIEAGKLYRCASSDKGGDTAGWFKLFEDGMGGVFGDWRHNWQESWQAARDRPMSANERQAFRKQMHEAAQQRDAEARAEHRAAADRAKAIFESAFTAPDDHPYLLAKGIRSHGLRTTDGDLVVPVRSGRTLQSLQLISGDGRKQFLKGGRVTGGYHSIGGEPADTLCVVEGFATGASVHEATGFPVAVAFNTGNLLPVGKRMREKFPGMRLIFCADDDAETEGNPGMTKAREAAQAVGGHFAIPDFGAERPPGATDFNDLARTAGAAAVRTCVEAAEAVNPAPIAEEPAEHAVLVRGDSIRPEPITWLWQDWIAAGKLHILAGAPGTGKTTLALALAATITCGGAWPDRTRASLGDVVIWSGEDSAEDVIIPRAMAMGADTSRLHIVQGVNGPDGRRPYDPAHDTGALGQALRSIPTVRLLIVDPIVSAVAGDSHHNAETRRSLQPLVDLAQAHGCALIGITHLSKGSAGRDPVERVTGSLAFAALARVVLMAAREQAEDDKPGRRLLLRGKSNIGPDVGGFAYDLVQDTLPGHPGVITSSVRWGVAVEGSARELMAQAEESEDDGSDDSKHFLCNLLVNGPRPAKEIFAEAAEAGYSRDQMYRAKKKAGITAKKQGMAAGWRWHLPAEDLGQRAEDSEDGASQSGTTFTTFGSHPPSSGAGGVEL